MFRKRPVIKFIPTPTYVKYASFHLPRCFRDAGRDAGQRLSLLGTHQAPRRALCSELRPEAYRAHHPHLQEHQAPQRDAAPSQGAPRSLRRGYCPALPPQGQGSSI